MRQVLGLAVAPVLASALVQVFGEGLGQTVGQRLGHDRVVIIVVLLELLAKFLGAEAGAHRKGAEVVGVAAHGSCGARGAFGAM